MKLKTNTRSTNLATTTALNAKINEVKSNVPNITDLANATALNVVENKIPDDSNLVKKSDYNTKVCEIENKISTDHDHGKYLATQEFHKLASERFTARLKHTNLASKNEFGNFMKKIYYRRWL